MIARILSIVLSLVAAAQLTPASARTIVLTNDDGLTSNLKAAYDALKAAGHDVIVVVPCRNQSGMGAALRYHAAADGRLAEDCRNGAAKAGEPGAGPMTRRGFERDFHYVDGTPVVALLYGLDTLAPARWNAAPDIVLSGPNEGRNTGPLILSSGTVANAQFAAGRGLPAVAISAGTGTVDDDALANPDSARVAAQLVSLVARLDAQSTVGRMLPAGISLNVNLPDAIEGARWRLARTGTYMPYSLRFSPQAVPGGGPLSGLTFETAATAPTAGQSDDEAAVSRTDIALTVMQPTFDQDKAAREAIAAKLGDLLAR